MCGIHVCRCRWCGTWVGVAVRQLQCWCVARMLTQTCSSAFQLTFYMPRANDQALFLFYTAGCRSAACWWWPRSSTCYWQCWRHSWGAVLRCSYLDQLLSACMLTWTHQLGWLHKIMPCFKAWSLAAFVLCQPLQLVQVHLGRVQGLCALWTQHSGEQWFVCCVRCRFTCSRGRGALWAA